MAFTVSLPSWDLNITGMHVMKTMMRIYVLQVLVYHDLLGMMQHPHHAKVTPKFCKQFGNVGQVVQEALQAYKSEVSSGAFPSAQFSPYKLAENEAAVFAEQLDAAGFSRAALAVTDMTQLSDTEVAVSEQKQ